MSKPSGKINEYHYAKQYENHTSLILAFLDKFADTNWGLAQ